MKALDAEVRNLRFVDCAHLMWQDYINIELDSHRNQLIQLELLLTAGMLAMALVTAIAGLFGMNLFNKEEGSYVVFLVVRTLQSYPTRNA